jgi:hypothetical protein
LSATNLAITTNADVQQMPSVAVNPLDPDHVVVAYMDYSLFDIPDNPATPDVDESYDHPYAGIGMAVSHDGGNTWDHSSIPLPFGFEQGAANPTVKFDNVDHDGDATNGVQNRAYVVFMAVTFKDKLPPITNPSGRDADGLQYRSYGMSANNGIFVSSSNDGGLSWGSAIAVDTNIFDDGTPQHNGTTKVPFDVIPDLAIDTFHAVTTQSGKQVNPMYATFSRYYPAGQYPGESNSAAGSNIMIAVSLDGGANWELKLEPNPAETPLDAEKPIDATVIYNQGLFRGTGSDFSGEGIGLENWAHVAVGPEGDVYVSQFAGAIFVVHHSTDGANSFEHPNPRTRTLYPFGLNVPTIPGPNLAGSKFRVQTVRAIAADPTKPGTVYVAEARPATDTAGNTTDEGEVVFARSTDYGARWQRTFGVGANANGNVVNDENDGLSATGIPGDVAAPQGLPRLVTDAHGDVALVWYDTRRDPDNKMLDVFASVSTDGGLTFSPNFRVTDQSFDADDGVFTDASEKDNYYLGDFLGLALANLPDDKTVMYAAWTDTRQGNQDIVFSRVELDPIPAPPNDRFETNDSKVAATELGTVVERDLPKLTIKAGDEDWFRLRTAATGTLAVSATLAAPGNNVRLELYDASGNTLLATGDGNGLVTEISRSSAVNESYLVRVLPPLGGTNIPIRYTLSLSSLTANLGTRAYGMQSGSLADGDDLFYSLVAAAPGSLEVTLTRGTNGQGNFHLELLDANTLESLTVGQPSGQTIHASLAVVKDQKVYVHVVGDADSHGDFTLSFSNLDQFTTQNNRTAFIPTGFGPSEIVLADVNLDGDQDVIVSHVGQNIISVILNNGDGTFQPPREFAVGAFLQQGPFTLSGVPNYHRDLAVANFDDDDFPDVIAVNPSSGDVSLLLGNGDGTFQPHRRFDATDSELANVVGDEFNSSVPFALAAGDVNNDGHFDVVVIDSSDVPTAQLAVRLGRGDGTFQTAKFYTLQNREENRTNAIRLVDVDGDDNLDLIERDFSNGTSVMLGNGDGTFQLNVDPIQPANGPGLVVADLDGDGNLDVVTTHNNDSEALYTLGNGDGTFAADSTTVVSGQFPIAVAVADFGSAVELPDGSFVLGPRDGHADLIVANNGRPLPTVKGPAEIVLLPGKVKDGQFDGFGDPIRLASAKGPLDIKVAHVNDDGAPGPADDVLDVLVVDRDGILVIFGQQPVIESNETLETARDLGTVVHVVEPTFTIVPGHSDAFFKLIVPTEAFEGAGDQVLDFSGGISSQEGAGLMMEVVDVAGNIRGSGERFRIVAEQGEQLFVHIFGRADGQGSRGAGAYTLVINTLPKVATVEPLSLVPGQGNQSGGPATSLVLVFQGDRLDAGTAEDPANYVITFLGPDGQRGGGGDRVIPVGAGLPAGSRTAIYDPSRNNVDATSGQSFPTAFRQTVTLLFGEALPVGNYEIQVSANVSSTRFNLEETDLLSSPVGGGFNGHPVVSVVGGTIREGAAPAALVPPVSTQFDLNKFAGGTNLLTQFHGDVGALLDALLTLADDPMSVTQNIIDQIVATFGPSLLDPVGNPIISLLVIVLDPVSINLADPNGRSFTFDLQAQLDTAIANNLPRAFVEVGGNVEVVVIANPSSEYLLRVADVPARARGAAVYFSQQATTPFSFTNDLRSGVGAFEILSPAAAAARSFAPALLALTHTATAQMLAAPLRLDASASRSNSAAPSLILTLASRSAALFSGASSALSSGSGGSSSRSWSKTAQDVWDAVFSSWDLFGRELVGDQQSEEEEIDGDDSSDTAPFERVWQTLSSIVDDILSVDEQEAQPSEGQSPQTTRKEIAEPATNQSGDQDPPPTADSQTGEVSSESQQTIPGQAAAHSPSRDRTPNTASPVTSASLPLTDSSRVSPDSSDSAGSSTGSQPHATAA